MPVGSAGEGEFFKEGRLEAAALWALLVPAAGHRHAVCCRAPAPWPFSSVSAYPRPPTPSAVGKFVKTHAHAAFFWWRWEGRPWGLGGWHSYPLLHITYHHHITYIIVNGSAQNHKGSKLKVFYVFPTSSSRFVERQRAEAGGDGEEERASASEPSKILLVSEGHVCRLHVVKIPCSSGGGRKVLVVLSPQ